MQRRPFLATIAALLPAGCFRRDDGTDPGTIPESGVVDERDEFRFGSDREGPRAPDRDGPRVPDRDGPQSASRRGGLADPDRDERSAPSEPAASRESETGNAL